jgi:hypothetical protein
MDIPALDPTEEDFVFEPTVWDLAVAIGIEVDADADRAALDELADAMLVWMADGPRLEQLTSGAVDALWSEELEAFIRDGLERLRADEDWRIAAGPALAELERVHQGAEVSREVVRHLAMQLSHADVPLFFCLDCLNDVVAGVPHEQRRPLATQAAVVARRDAAVTREELSAVVAAPTAADRLGTPERRRAVRRRLGRLADLGAVSLRALARELRSLADEPLPSTPAEDEVWQVVVAALLADVATPELN